MGLDIYVCKPIQATNELIIAEASEDLPDNLQGYSIHTHPLLNRWKQFSFKKSIEYINFEESFQQLGKNFYDYEWTMSDEKGIHFQLKTNKSKLVICWDKAITFLQEEDILIVEEVGWQRKGANSLFYEKNEKTGISMWDSEPVITKDLLLNHWEKYFSYRTPDSPGGFGSGVEFNQADSEMKQNFKENIIDKFIEGDNFVIYA